MLKPQIPCRPPPPLRSTHGSSVALQPSWSANCIEAMRSTVTTDPTLYAECLMMNRFGHTNSRWTPAPPPLLEPPEKLPPVELRTQTQVVSLAELEDIRRRAYSLWRAAGSP